MRRTGRASDCHCEERLYLVASICALIGFVASMIGYIISGSAALIADGFHALADSTDIFLSLVVVIFVRRYVAHEERIRKVGAVIAFILLVGSTLFVLFHALLRLLNAHEIAPLPMLISALVATAVNWYVLTLSHKTPEHERTNTHELMHIHATGDLMISVGVIAVACFYLFFPWGYMHPVLATMVWNALDPVVAIVIAIYMIGSLWPRAYRRI